MKSSINLTKTRLKTRFILFFITLVLVYCIKNNAVDQINLKLNSFTLIGDCIKSDKINSIDLKSIPSKLIKISTLRILSLTLGSPSLNLLENLIPPKSDELDEVHQLVSPAKWQLSQLQNILENIMLVQNKEHYSEQQWALYNKGLVELHSVLIF